MIRHSLLYFLVRATNGILGVVTLSVFSRLLSPQEYGVYALGMSVAIIASSVLFQWLNVAVGRFYPMYRDRPQVIMVAARRGFWIAAAVAALLSAIVLPFHKAIGVEPLFIGLLLLITVAQGRYDLSLQVVNSQGLPLRYGRISWAKMAVCLLVGTAFILRGAGEQGALLGFLVGLLVAVIVFDPIRNLRSVYNSPDTRISGELFNYGFPLTLTFLAIMIVDLADRLIIGWILGASHVAPYATAYDLVQQTIGAIMNVLFMAGFPAIVLALEQGKDEYGAFTRLHDLGRAHVGIGLAAAVGLGTLSDQIAATFVGEALRHDAARVIPWLAAAIFVGCFKSYYLDLPFQVCRVTRYQGYIAVMMAVVNVALNLLLLPRYGILGAAWATLAAFLIGAFMSWRVGRRIHVLPGIGKDFLKATFASATMALALRALPPLNGIHWLIIKISYGAGVYVIASWVLNVSGCRDQLSSILRSGCKDH
jgi:O-antigen/teichoic acid export membrane protein